MDIKQQLLKLSTSELKERKKARRDYFFYLGEYEDKEAAICDMDLLGQNWIVTDDLDYVPSQVIDNKVKPLIAKQARFMFGKEPDILFKPYDKADKEKAEELRQYIDGILNSNKFWSNTLKAFRLATVTKRVLLRLEANPNQSVRLFYHDINDFSYEVNPNDISQIVSVSLVKQDSATAKEDVTHQIWFRYTYFVQNDKCYLKTEKFKGDDLDTPIEVVTKDTGLNKLPCWVIVNEQSLTSSLGSSDLKDLKPLQKQYNSKLSDFSDALRFNMFGMNVFIDAQEEGVNNAKVAPNSIIALVSTDDKKADMKKVESAFTNAEPVDKYLTRLENSMYEKLGIPRPEQLANVPSAKSIKYMYNDLIARCSEKWHDWEPAIRSMLRLIVEACGKFNCYDDWKHEWDKLQYNIVIKKNYPIPEDEEDQKRLAMEEVQNNVRSHRSYIKDFADDEDVEGSMKEIADDIKMINQAEQDQFQKSVQDDLNGDDK